MTIDFSDEEDVRQRDKNVRNKRKEWVNDLKVLMGMEEGQRVLWRIMDQTKMLAPNLFAPSAHDMVYRVGQRDLGLWLYNELILADKDLFMAMLKKDKSEDG